MSFSKRALLEIVKCVICMDSAEKAQMCPRCQKVLCQACIKRWSFASLRPECPHCKAHVKLTEFVKCRVADEITELLAETVTNDNSTEDVNNPRAVSQNERCKNHNELLTVYCEDCQITMCHRTALWNPDLDHKEHCTKPIGIAYQEQMEKIGIGIFEMQLQASKISYKIGRANEEIKIFGNARDEAVRLLLSALTSMSEFYLDPIKNHRNVWTKELKDIESAIDEVKSEQASCSPAEFCTKQPKLQRKIQDLTKSSLPMLTWKMAPLHANFVESIFSAENSPWFTIKKFSQLRETGGCVFSPIRCIDKMLFQLEVGTDKYGLFGKQLSVFVRNMDGLFNSQGKWDEIPISENVQSKKLDLLLSVQRLTEKIFSCQFSVCGRSTDRSCEVLDNPCLDFDEPGSDRIKKMCEHSTSEAGSNGRHCPEIYTRCKIGMIKCIDAKGDGPKIYAREFFCGNGNGGLYGTSHGFYNLNSLLEEGWVDPVTDTLSLFYQVELLDTIPPLDFSIFCGRNVSLMGSRQ